MPGLGHILVVDDEPGVRSVLRQGLEDKGFRVFEAADKTELFAVLDSETIDLVTLDIGLGSSDGLLLAREIRADFNIPIFMITGRSAAVDRVRALEQGADDYICKPFYLTEVTLRIRNTLRRYPPLTRNPDLATEGTPRRLKFAAGMLDSTMREFTDVHGKPVELTETELALLEFFLRHPARILSRDEIMCELRGRHWSPEKRLLDGHVARLRRKIAPPREAPKFVKSVRGVGYVFTGEVHPG